MELSNFLLGVNVFYLFEVLRLLEIKDRDCLIFLLRCVFLWGDAVGFGIWGVGILFSIFVFFLGGVLVLLLELGVYR